MKHQITIEDTAEHYPCDEHESVLHGMARLGRRGIPLGCRGGGCGVCKVQVTQGSYEAKVMSQATSAPRNRRRARCWPAGSCRIATFACRWSAR